MNVNFTIYLNRIRIQKALDFIESGEVNVLNISTMCGYRDGAYFSKVFKKLVGKTSKEYIKQKSKG